jgi:tRNA A-37 threonylcarbamoyl transferase component Bud32
MSEPEHDHSQGSSEMSPPASKKLREIFLEAAEIEDVAARAAFLNRACGDDALLRRRLEELLAADSAAGPAPAQPPSAPQGPGEAGGSVIGRYKLLEQIGEGGCGVVYVAEQQEPVKRRVALKIIKLGMDTRSVIARFEAERQALAMMDHPNIARVLDAGATETGRPYFVMELVGGIKITDYCEQNNLTTRQRLDLFIQVCHAIQHAHQKGVIHRDIKPSNVLVATQDGVPIPKVIDFGIAKAGGVNHGYLLNKGIFTDKTKSERKSMNNKFDELTKSMAQSVTRRGALKKFGVGLAGMALAFFGLADKAGAGGPGAFCQVVVGPPYTPAVYSGRCLDIASCTSVASADCPAAGTVQRQANGIKAVLCYFGPVSYDSRKKCSFAI